MSKSVSVCADVCRQLCRKLLVAPRPGLEPGTCGLTGLRRAGRARGSRRRVTSFLSSALAEPMRRTPSELAGGWLAERRRPNCRRACVRTSRPGCFALRGVGPMQSPFHVVPDGSRGRQSDGSGYLAKAGFSHNLPHGVPQRLNCNHVGSSAAVSESDRNWLQFRLYINPTKDAGC